MTYQPDFCTTCACETSFCKEVFYNEFYDIQQTVSSVILGHRWIVGWMSVYKVLYFYFIKNT